MPWRAFRLALATLVFAATAALLASPSQAARYHRFKRVDGHWIEGHFVSHASRSSFRSARRELRRQAAARVRERHSAAAKAMREASAHPETTASIRPVAVEPPARVAPEPSRDLMQALRRKAAERAAQLTGGAAAPGNGTEPVSVTLNFKTGMKATSFRNGDVSKEPFDPSAVRALAASPPPRAPR